jgi:hypothetical protein
MMMMMMMMEEEERLEQLLAPNAWLHLEEEYIMYEEVDVFHWSLSTDTRQVHIV